MISFCHLNLQKGFLRKVRFGFFFLIHLFWGRGERPHVRTQAGVGQRDWERENPKQSLGCQLGTPHSAQCQELQDHDLSQNQEATL